MGGPLTNALVYGTRKFVEANPKITESVVAALDEATGWIQADPEKAARTYLEATKERISVDELVAMMRQPGVVFSTTPYGSMLQAEHYVKTGMIKMRPKDWREFYFPSIHDRQGN